MKRGLFVAIIFTLFSGFITFAAQPTDQFELLQKEIAVIKNDFDKYKDKHPTESQLSDAISTVTTTLNYATIALAGGTFIFMVVTFVIDFKRRKEMDFSLQIAKESIKSTQNEMALIAKFSKFEMRESINEVAKTESKEILKKLEGHIEDYKDVFTNNMNKIRQDVDQLDILVAELTNDLTTYFTEKSSIALSNSPPDYKLFINLLSEKNNTELAVKRLLSSNEKDLFDGLAYLKAAYKLPISFQFLLNELHRQGKFKNIRMFDLANQILELHKLERLDRNNCI